jgi:hypothetical protein
MPDQIICRMVTNEKTGEQCGKAKRMTQGGIGVCPSCDVTGPVPWPSGYVEWLPGMPYPGDVDA